MRDHLLGYLLQALEPDEHQQVERHLAQDAQSRRELEALQRCLEPLVADRGHFDPPPGLAVRTCEFVSRRIMLSLSPPAPSVPRRGWSMADLAMAAGIFLAAALMFFPAVSQSRYNARLATCQNNLRQLGISLARYSENHGGYFPELREHSKFGVAGIYAPRLMKAGYIDNPSWVVCPSSSLADAVDHFTIPSDDVLRDASGPKLAEVQRQIGGSYGFNLGYRAADGRYHSPKNLRRSTFALMADKPQPDGNELSTNHARHSQNVMFEDGHVECLTSSVMHDGDNIFLSSRGRSEAGVGRDDAVIGCSEATPTGTRDFDDE